MNKSWRTPDSWQIPLENATANIFEIESMYFGFFTSVENNNVEKLTAHKIYDLVDEHTNAFDGGCITVIDTLDKAI